MMRKIILLGLQICLLLSLTGCWDIKTIQDTNYITAIGFDYQKGKYVVYGQMIDFSSVAKQEGGKSGQPATVWVGHEEGETVDDAFNKLYRTAQQRMFWGHVFAFVFTDAALQKGINVFTDGIVRYGETRFTQWFYSTYEPIDRIFTVTPFFNLSPVASILAHPLDNYRQRSYIQPVRLYHVLADFREPGMTTLIPVLSINKNVWEKNDKTDPKLQISGVHAIDRTHSPVTFTEDQLAGLRWMDKNTVRAVLKITINGENVGTASILNPRATIKPQVIDGRISFAIGIKGKAVIKEITKKIDENLLKQQIEKEMKEEVERTFKIGMEQGIDLFSLEHYLYKNAFSQWSQLTAQGTKPLKEVQLGTIRVDVKIMHSGMYKMQQKQRQEY
ncbi:Ger(x)C family spore germination protein [Paenibacillus sp. SI8]|uniref:Ger(x)C family spore germination protein n=1 Tax=unclassified Paenibacillus TaxID=185978 RepID=UPI003466C68F